MSAGDFVQGTSGWRRTVPVEEQGASSSTASNSSSGSKSGRRPATISASQAEPLEIARQPRQPVLRSVDRGDLAPARISCAVLPPGAAQRSATRWPAMSPSSRAGKAGGGILHPPFAFGEARQFGDGGGELLDAAPCRSAARCRRASRPSAAGSDLTVKSTGASTRCAARIASPCPRHRPRSAARRTSPAHRRWRRASAASSSSLARAKRRSTPLTRPAKRARARIGLGVGRRRGRPRRCRECRGTGSAPRRHAGCATEPCALGGSGFSRRRESSLPMVTRKRSAVVRIARTRPRSRMSSARYADGRCRCRSARRAASWHR